MESKPIKLNIGGGRKILDGFTNIDLVQFVDGNGKNCVDIVMDIEKEKLPFADGSVDEILADNVLEHLLDLRFMMNECHRVLKVGGLFHGYVPVAGSPKDYKDPTHVRRFIKETFEYFTGSNPAMPSRPGHPKYADYGFMPWHYAEPLSQADDLILFKLTPRK